MRLLIPTATALLLVATAAGAQGATPLVYKHAAGDTLRYHLHSTSVVDVSAAMGSDQITSVTDAAIALRFAGGDSVAAWFDTLSITGASARGQFSPPMGDLIGKVWTLKMDERGRVETLAPPELPASMQRGANVGDQFEDLLPRLPGRELKVGDSWADTVNKKTKGRAGGNSSINSISTFRVAREATIDGRRMLFIEEKTHAKTVSEGVSTRTTLEGDATGTINFAADEGRLVRYTQHEDMKGVTQGASSGDVNTHRVSDHMLVLRQP